MKSIKETILREAIKETDGKIFSVSFVKKDGSIRKMTARTHVKVGVKGSTPEATAKRKETLAENGMVGVYDMNKLPENYDSLPEDQKEKIKKGAFRTINLLTVKEFVFQQQKLSFES
jgi:hypothetical protein